MRIDISMLVNADPISYKTGGRAIKEKIGEAVDALFTERANKNKYCDHILIMGDDPKASTIGASVRGYEPTPKLGRGDKKIGSVRLVKTHSVPW